MRLTADEFRHWPNRRLTLLGMSGVGKTRLAAKLDPEQWFHFSGDYRIGTHYLDEPILDNIKSQAMQVPFLRDLLRSDSIYIANNISIDNLKPVSSFLGKVGDPERGGLSLKEFKRRQALHREAEVAAMLDVPDFIRKGRELYDYPHFINDAGGSVSELDHPRVMEVLAENTVILYIKATQADQQELIRRAELAPKPLYYREEFLDAQLGRFMQERDLEYVAMVDPDEFMRWVFPALFHSRMPRYDAIAQRYGYTVTTDELATIRDEADFLELLTSRLASSPDGA